VHKKIHTSEKKNESGYSGVKSVQQQEYPNQTQYTHVLKFPGAILHFFGFANFWWILQLLIFEMQTKNWRNLTDDLGDILLSQKWHLAYVEKINLCILPSVCMVTHNLNMWMKSFTNVSLVNLPKSSFAQKLHQRINEDTANNAVREIFAIIVENFILTSN
jgi:hypothetical protein